MYMQMCVVTKTYITYISYIYSYFIGKYVGYMYGAYSSFLGNSKKSFGFVMLRA